MRLENHARKSYFIFVNLGFTLSKLGILLLAVLTSVQQTEAEAKPEAKLPMGHRRVRVREKGRRTGEGQRDGKEGSAGRRHEKLEQELRALGRAG